MILEAEDGHETGVGFQAGRDSYSSVFYGLQIRSEGHILFSKRGYRRIFTGSRTPSQA
jgi:hypothetical protein